MGEFKKAGRLDVDAEPHGTRRLSSFPHGPLAVILLCLSLIIRFGVPLTIHGSESLNSDLRSVILILTALGVVLWMWGCVHLALRLRLRPTWALVGSCFLSAWAFFSMHQRRCRNGNSPSGSFVVRTARGGGMALP